MGIHERTATRSAPIGIIEMAWQVNDLGGGEYTITVGAREELFREDWSPSQPGDVLSIQPGGERQTRAAGANGPYERCRPNGNLMVYRPQGPAGRAFGVAYASDCPNPE